MFHLLEVNNYTLLCHLQCFLVVCVCQWEEELHNDDKRLFAALVRPQCVEDKPDSE